MFRGSDSEGNPKYIARSKAVVLDNRDPLNKGRIIVDHPLLGNTVWIEYLRVPGFFSVPSVGDLVYVECDSGTHEFPVAWGNATKGKDASPEIPAVFKKDVPTNRGIYTPGGHTVEFDDGDATPGSDPKYDSRTTKNRGIRITSSSGHKIHIADDSENSVQSITIMDKEGDGVVFNAQTKEVNLISKGKMSISAEDTMSIDAPTVNVSGDTIDISGSEVTVQGSTKTTVGSSGSPTEVNGQQVKLAGGGPGVARVGDRAFGIGNLGAPVSSTIIQGSPKVLSG